MLEGKINRKINVENNKWDGFMYPRSNEKVKPLNRKDKLDLKYVR